MKNNVLFLFLFVTAYLSPAFAADFQYLSPVPNSTLNSRQTNIIVRPGAVIDNASIKASLFSVQGSLSGTHAGDTYLSDDERTILFQPFVPFEPGEIVTVHLAPGITTTHGEPVGTVKFAFTVSPVRDAGEPSAKIDAAPSQPLKFVTLKKSTDTLPSDFPTLSVTNSDHPSEGRFFIANKPAGGGASYGSYVIIADNQGNAVKYMKFSKAESNFRILPSGEYGISEGGGLNIILDTNLVPIDTLQCGNGYTADSHDFLVLPNGHALLFAADREPVDMSKIVPGGNPDATVIGSIIQELDASKHVIFQWRSWDEIPITDSYLDLTAKTIDYVHQNALEVDTDGNFLVSMRHTSNIYKIDRKTGKIIWTLGGKKNDFTFINDHEENAPTYFSFQHDIHLLHNGNITLFDNGDLHVPEYSRGVEYQLDQKNKTATMVWEYRHNPDIYTSSGGSVQRLPNGNTVIGWSRAGATVGIPMLTEVHPDNVLALEMYLPQGQFSYRSFKFPLAERTPHDSVIAMEVLDGNTYEFNNSTDSTGITIKFTQLTADQYANAIVTRSNVSPPHPNFLNDAPIMATQYFTIQQQLITAYTGEVHVDLHQYSSIVHPGQTVVYGRPEFGEIFSALPTNFDSVKNELVFTTSDFGEFAFGVPQVIEANAPGIIAPMKNEIVNSEMPVQLSWGIRGIAQSFRLQTAFDSSFLHVVVDTSGLTSPSLTLDAVQNDTVYYWRVNVSNSVGTSDWSPIGAFKTSLPFISVAFPNGGERFYYDSSYVIRWNSNLHDTVNIYLMNGTDTTAVIAKKFFSRTNTFAWKIPGTIEIDSTYSVRIVSATHMNLMDASDLPFTVDQSVTSVGGGGSAVRSYALDQNYPNPFNPTTTIRYSIPVSSRVQLEIFDLLGRKVATMVDNVQQAGEHTVVFSASSLPSGIYFYRLSAGSFSQIRRMVLIK